MGQKRPVQQLTPAVSSNRGFTLIEMLVALVVIMVALLGLVQAALLGIDNNLKNLLRDEAVRIAEEQMNVLKSQPITNLTATTNKAIYTISGNPLTRTFGNYVGRYAVYYTIVILTSNTTNIQVTVGWNYKHELPPIPVIGTEYQYLITSVVASAE